MRPTAVSLWPDCAYDPPAGITRSYHRLHTMAEAYAQPGTGLTGDAGLAADIITGLDHLDTTVYNPPTTRYGNWWEWQIGSPRLLLDTLAILDERLPAGRTHRRPARPLPRRGRPLRPRHRARRLHRHQHRRQPRRPLPRRRTPRRPRPRPRQDRARPRRPLPGLPLRHQGRRPLRRRLLRPAHLGRLLGHLRLRPARRTRPAVHPAPRLGLGGHRPRTPGHLRQRRARVRAAAPQRPDDGQRQRARHQPRLLCATTNGASCAATTSTATR